MSEPSKYLYVDTPAIAQNAAAIVGHVPVPVIGVVKADGYGLGAAQLAWALLQNGVRTLAVSRIEEAQALRDAGIQNEIILLSPTELTDEAERIVALELTAAIGSLEGATILGTAARAAGVRLRAHIKLDVGFGRFGFLPGDTDIILKTCASLDMIDITGVFAHLSNAFGRKPDITLRQAQLFSDTVEVLRARGLSLPLRHLANSCAALRFPETHFDAVRVGSAFLGRLPVRVTVPLLRVGELRARVCTVRTLPAGHNVGYANIYKTKGDTRTAVLPIGYTDGYCTEKSHDALRFIDIIRYMWGDFQRIFLRRRLYVTLCGKRARVIGRVGATHCVVDARKLDVRPGDMAMLPANPLLVPPSILRVYE